MELLLNYVGAVRYLESLGFVFRTSGMENKVAALQKRVAKRAIPHRRRSKRVVMFDPIELKAWYRGDPVPVGAR